MSHFSSYPLLFAIMSGKHKQDYIGIFSATKIFLSAENVKTITLDFEAAMWQAVAEVIPTVTRLGHFFHWSQVIWHKVQELDLQPAYSSNENTHTYIHKLLSLPYLPAEHIDPIFEKLQEKAAIQPLKELTNYTAST